MQFEEVSKRYRETNLATMPMTDYMLHLLKNALDIVVACQSYEDVVKQREQLMRGQNILFELMAITNQKRQEGKRLFNFYIYLNQCLVKFRIEGDAEQLQQVARYLTELIDAWQTVKWNRPFTTE